jgi:anti-anti-sigma regulatory factor
MQISMERLSNDPPVTLIRLQGDLDASSYRQVIAAGQTLYNSGGRYLLLDLSEVEFMSSSGLVALHSIALIFRGEKTPDLEQGWSAMHAVADYVEGTSVTEKYFKLLNPTTRVMQTLEKTGFNQTFEIFTDREQALASFS